MPLLLYTTCLSFRFEIVFQRILKEIFLTKLDKYLYNEAFCISLGHEDCKLSDLLLGYKKVLIMASLYNKLYLFYFIP